VVGWFQGRMEFGPRALGARSILGDPRSPRMQSLMNLKIKLRESFRPFAPAMLAEHASEWFDLPHGQESPYMLLVAALRPEYRIKDRNGPTSAASTDDELRRRVHEPRSTVPAITHVDYSARLQTVDRGRNPRFHRLIELFHERTGCPMLVNTSFNIRGEPIVGSPEDALRCFRATEMDALVLEDCLIQKSDVGTTRSDAELERYRSQFPLD
jgi:carbamoyltransferase